jgi:hypothetical protein
LIYTATSNAPRTRRKRRYSSTEREAERDDDQPNKKARGDSATPSLADADGLFMGPPPAPQRDTSEVKEVTEGVKEVDLDGKDPTPGPDPVDREVAESVAHPESIPLPEEKFGELDQPGSDTFSTPSPVSAPLDGVLEKRDAGAEEDSDDVASSSEENTLVPEEDKLQKKIDVKVLDPAESTIEQIYLTTEA